MGRDQIEETALLQLSQTIHEAENPRDGYGAGFLVYSLAADFHALCCLAGPEAARQEMAEIINSEFERKRS